MSNLDPMTTDQELILSLKSVVKNVAEHVVAEPMEKEAIRWMMARLDAAEAENNRIKTNIKKLLDLGEQAEKALAATRGNEHA